MIIDYPSVETYAANPKNLPMSAQYGQRSPTTQFKRSTHFTDNNLYRGVTVQQTTQLAGQTYTSANRLVGVSTNLYSTIPSHSISMPHVPSGACCRPTSVHLADQLSSPHQHGHQQQVSTNYVSQQPYSFQTNYNTSTQPVSLNFSQSGSFDFRHFDKHNGQPVSTTNVVPVSAQSFGLNNFHNLNRFTEPSQPPPPLAQPSGFAQTTTPATTVATREASVSVHALTQSQIAARHVVPRKLPLFFGDIEKFPSFLRAYETSTSLCGFSNDENLTRLNESLKGSAYEFVEQQLLYPDDVPQVIETLKVIFGRPEYVIDKLLEKITKQPPPQAEDLSSLVKYSMNVQNICGTIKAANATEHLNNPSLMKALVDKLPPSIQLNWAFHKQNVPDVNLYTLGTWLRELAKLACSVAGPPKVKNMKKFEKVMDYVNAQVESSSTSKKDNGGLTAKDKKNCKICKQKSCHSVKDCSKFQSLNSKDRWSAVREHGICIRCLGDHRIKSCWSKCNVGECQRAHNALLHESEIKDTKSNSQVDPGFKVNCSHTSVSKKVDIFRIIPIRLSHNETVIQTFAYLDDGSNVTMMEDDLAVELGLEMSLREKLCVKWSFGRIRREAIESHRVQVVISGVYENAAQYTLHDVRTVSDLALPSPTLSQEWLDSYKHFKGIPIAMYINAKPRMLIGLQYSKLMVSRRTIEGNWTEPIACKTRLGWVVQGPDGGDRSKGTVDSNFSLKICECQGGDNELHQLIKDFFCWDSFGVSTSQKLPESNEIQRARKLLETTTKKIDGRYETGLLWRFDNVKFPNTYKMALKRLQCLERKMERDPELAKKMCDYIQDFVAKIYVRKLAKHELQKVSRTLYLPLFPVFNPKKPDKFRVVWDAAAKVDQTSLNSMLLTGPDLLKPLPDVLRRFRENAVAVTGDMKEMFHQVRVIASDVHAQRFLWRDGNSKIEPDVYVMEVLTFGGKNSPCSAQYVKNKNALEYINQFPRAVEAINENHYQDDMLESFGTVEEAVRHTKEVKLIHSYGGFEMRSFKSNSFDVLKELGEKLEDHQMNLDISIEQATERVLFMFWHTSTDAFTFSLKFIRLTEEAFKGKVRPTKREVLRAIMSIFDPLGLIAHYLVYRKILLQRIWRDGTNWDEKLSDSSNKLWLEWIENLPEIENIKIPRWYSPKLMSGNTKVQLHVFVDASIEACAAAVYYRIEDENGVDCCLIGAKTKVAPNKPLSIPILELQAAVLGVRLAGNIGKCQRIQVIERFFWSDSQTVLGWIHSEARKFHQYAAFRMVEVLENSSTSEWNWVDTKNNVADDATKWKNKPELSSSARWFKAPSFLYQPQNTWPAAKDRADFVTTEEMRAVYLLSHIEVPNNNVMAPENFSSWNRLRRSMAYVLRFIDNFRSRRKDRQIGPLTREEHRRAQNILFKQAQRAEFLEEILTIRANESLPVGERRQLHKSSTLRNWSPYLDEEGLLRIKGRNDAAPAILFKTKRPIILPRHHRITKLVVLWYHQKFHHINHQTTLNEINQTFAIQALRVVLKNVIKSSCQRCENDKANPIVPEMAELPPARLTTFTKPFTYTGVDYFGPMKVKVRRSVEKRWGVIFTSLTTRAVYIEVAHSLDTSSCILCVRNFMNRHGQPVTFYSDNGTNFLAADAELRKEFENLKQSRMEEEFTNDQTQWKFNPPTAAHMGGAWERLIRTVKSVLSKTMPTRTLTYEMLRSFLIEAENIVNSRPLTYVQFDHIDDEVLTPNHFVKLYSNGIKCPGQFNSKNLLRDDWKAVQEMTNQFWKRFVVEYLPTLTRRTKWFKDVKPLEVGDLVVVVDEESDRNDWRKGVIEEVVMGKGGQVRRALVRLIRGEKRKLTDVDVEDIRHQSLWRPAAKLAVLDVKGNKLSK